MFFVLNIIDVCNTDRKSSPNVINVFKHELRNLRTSDVRVEEIFLQFSRLCSCLT